jgi:hypothetical protein
MSIADFGLEAARWEVEQLLVNCGLEAARWEVEQLLVSGF